MPITSKLAKVIGDLPDDSTVKKAGLPNLLKKGGVKQEELDFAKLPLPEKDKLAKTDLLEAESKRADKFDVQEATGDYQAHSLGQARNNPTYREKVYTYSEKGAQYQGLDNPATRKALTEARSLVDEHETIDAAEVLRRTMTDHEGALGLLEDGHTVDEVLQIMGGSDPTRASRYTSSHYPDEPNYLMHTRVYDDTFDGTQTRVVQEVQSDLHQAGRQRGYDRAATLTNEEHNVLRTYLDDDSDEALDAAIDVALSRGFTPQQDLESFVEDLLRSKVSTVPSSPFEKTWLRKGLEREIDDALAEGREQIAIPIKGRVEDLKRGDGVQKWYETTVLNTAEKLAKSSNMSFDLKTVDDVTYAMLRPRVAPSPDQVSSILASKATNDEKAKALRNLGLTDKAASNALLGSQTPDQVAKSWTKPNFSLYASPAASAATVYTMLREGYGSEEITSMLIDQGLEQDDISEVYSLAEAVSTMRAEGYEINEITPLLEQREVLVNDVKRAATSTLEPREANRFSNAYRIITGNEKLTAKDLMAIMEIIYSDMSSVTTNLAGMMGDQEAARASEEAVQASRARIIEALGKRGLNAEWSDLDNKWFANTEYGKVEITPEWYRSFWAAKGELTGGIGGALSSYKAASKLPLKGIPRLAAVVGGTLFGGALGAAAGTEVDYLHAALVLQEDMEAEVMARKAITAAEMSVIGDVVGAGIIKVTGATWRGLGKVVRFVRDNTLDKAHVALKETMFITDEEAKVLVDKLARVSVTPEASKRSLTSKILGDAETDKSIQAVALTEPGGEDLVRAAAATDARASQATSKAIDVRAKDVLASTKALSIEDIGRVLREDLEGYKTLVRDNYARVKGSAASTPGLNNFKFNYNELAIEPVLNRLFKNIENKDVSFKFLKQSRRIRDMSNSRRLPDLIELRKLVNDFRYNTRISKDKDYKMLDDLKAGIDKAIEQGAHKTMEKPKAWLNAWKESNRLYSEMKTLEKNSLNKVLLRPGVSEKAIGQALTKYATALDSTFVDVLAKLPKKTRTNVEGEVLSNLANKYTTGLEGGQRATNFPGLVDELKDVSFTTPAARSMKKALTELSEVFRNDVPLSQVTGTIQIQKFQSFLTADPVVRAKFEVASGIFNWVRSLSPTQSGRSLALVRKTSEVLENPLNSKSLKELQKMLDGEVDLTKPLEDMLETTARQQAADSGLPRVKLYGDSKVLAGKGNGKEHSIPMHRIANTEMVKQIAETNGINLADKKALDYALRERGYIAAQLGADKVRLLGD